MTTAVRALVRMADMSPEWFLLHLPRLGLARSTLPTGGSLVMRATRDDSISNQVFWRGCFGFEPEMSPLFFALAKEARVTLDVGAYSGYYAILALHANPHGRVIALEPLPAVFERLQENAALNDGERITCLRQAAGIRDGEAEFFYKDMSLPSSSSLSLEFMRATPDLTSCRVEVVSIDRLVENERLDRVDLIKIDTEGTEPDVLAGMPKTLGRDRPHIFCEVLVGQDTGPALQHLLRPHGYFYYLLTPSGAVHRGGIEADPQWKNHLFTVLEPRAVAELRAHDSAPGYHRHRKRQRTL